MKVKLDQFPLKLFHCVSLYRSLPHALFSSFFCLCHVKGILFQKASLCFKKSDGLSHWPSTIIHPGFCGLGTGTQGSTLPSPALGHHDGKGHQHATFRLDRTTWPFGANGGSHDVPSQVEVAGGDQASLFVWGEVPSQNANCEEMSTSNFIHWLFRKQSAVARLVLLRAHVSLQVWKHPFNFRRVSLCIVHLEGQTLTTV